MGHPEFPMIPNKQHGVIPAYRGANSDENKSSNADVNFNFMQTDTEDSQEPHVTFI